jgi:hypothetical protein
VLAIHAIVNDLRLGVTALRELLSRFLTSVIRYSTRLCVSVSCVVQPVGSIRANKCSAPPCPGRPVAVRKTEPSMAGIAPATGWSIFQRAGNKLTPS